MDPSRTPSKSDMMRVALAVAMAVVLSVLAPFTPALEIHHALAAADDDGHEHSASDLCQWVQHHTGSSVPAHVPTLFSTAICFVHECPRPGLLVSVRLTSVGHSRAPPIR